MNIEIEDELQTEESKNVAELLKKVASFAAEDELKHKNFEVTITITDNDGIHELNREYRQVDSATDVLSFPLWNRDEEPFINPENDCIMLGDIVISLPRAKEQAEEYGHSVRRECAYLCIHGVMHLLGYDHIEESDKTVMRAREEDVLGKLQITRED